MAKPAIVQKTDTETVTDRLVEKEVMVTVVLAVLMRVKKNFSSLLLSSSSRVLSTPILSWIRASVSSNSWCSRIVLTRRNCRPTQSLLSAAVPEAVKTQYQSTPGLDVCVGLYTRRTFMYALQTRETFGNIFQLLRTLTYTSRYSCINLGM